MRLRLRLLCLYVCGDDYVVPVGRAVPTRIIGLCYGNVKKGMPDKCAEQQHELVSTLDYWLGRRPQSDLWLKPASTRSSCLCRMGWLAAGYRDRHNIPASPRKASPCDCERA